MVEPRQPLQRGEFEGLGRFPSSLEVDQLGLVGPLTSTTDTYIFAVLRVFDPQGEECSIVGAHEKVPMALGWRKRLVITRLRVSRRCGADSPLDKPA